MVGQVLFILIYLAVALPCPYSAYHVAYGYFHLQLTLIGLSLFILFSCVGYINANDLEKSVFATRIHILLPGFILNYYSASPVRQ